MLQLSFLLAKTGVAAPDAADPAANEDKGGDASIQVTVANADGSATEVILDQDIVRDTWERITVEFTATSTSLMLTLSALEQPGTSLLADVSVVRMPKFTVTGSNTGGEASAALLINVVDVAPSSLVYPVPAGVYTIAKAIPQNTPGNNGGEVLAYRVTPPLPAGLVVSPTTGTISGTPEEARATTTYTVTATNTGGSTVNSITITVLDLPPAGLAYSSSEATGFVNTPFAPLTPSTEGGGPVRR